MIRFILLFVFCVLGFSAWLAQLELSYKCNNYQKITGTPTMVVFLDSCYVRSNNRWMRWDEYKILNATSAVKDRE